VRGGQRSFVVSRLDLPNSAPSRNPETIDPDRLLQARSVAARFDISVRTLDRWMQARAFPQPVMTTKDITGRVCARFWRLGDLIEWETAQQGDCAANHTHL
jgi:predicted DNA-binding transcriptional regulator AlpA